MFKLSISRRVVAVFSLCLIFCIGLFGCSTNAPKPSVFLRPDVDTSKSKVIVFPMLLLSGNNVSAANTDYSNPLVDAAIGAKWSSSIGASNSVIIPKIAFDKIPKASEAVAVLIHALDTTSAVERTGLTQNFFQTITGQFGDGALAFAFVTQNKKEYESSKSVQVNMGLFDTKKMTWKWTTKHGYRQGIVPIPYEIVIRDLVSESFTELTQKNGGKAI